MDTFTRNYSILLGLIMVVALGFWVKSSWQPQVWALNDVLTSDTMLAHYPYQFRLRGLRDGTAIISTPRDANFPAYRFVQVIRPELVGKDPDDPLMTAALHELIKHQQRAQDLMLAQPQVERVDWALDVQWLADHGVHASAKP